MDGLVLAQEALGKQKCLETIDNYHKTTMIALFSYQKRNQYMKVLTLVMHKKFFWIYKSPSAS